MLVDHAWQQHQQHFLKSFTAQWRVQKFRKGGPAPEMGVGGMGFTTKNSKKASNFGLKSGV
jgi:hypothetical protein